MSQEARSEFGNTAVVSTVHAYAYHYMIRPATSKLNKNIAGWLTWRDIPKSVRRPFGSDSLILATIEDFCNSQYLTVEDFLQNYEAPFNPRLVTPLKQILNLMANGHMRITHSFYLKLFHIKVMSGAIKLDYEDRLYVDEFQDSSSIVLDIIEHIPAKQKVFVGDTSQRIFDFLKLENGFNRYPDAAVYHLTKSFRVDNSYAPAIQAFLRKHLDPTADFVGMDYPPDQPINSYAYLTRTNASLIAKMIELNEEGTPYQLGHTTKLKQMFKFPLALIYAKPGFNQQDPELLHLQHDIDDWGKLSIKDRQKISKLSWIMKQNPDDQRIKQAARLISEFEPEAIIRAYEEGDKHRKSGTGVLLSTVHSAKGLTKDSVELDPDVDESIEEFLDTPMELLTEEEESLLCLYFVSISRHRYELKNAKYLEELIALQESL